MTDTKLLRELITNAGLKYKYVASTLGITPQALQQKIENDREFKASEIDGLAKLLDLTPADKDRIFSARTVNLIQKKTKAHP